MNQAGQVIKAIDFIPEVVGSNHAAFKLEVLPSHLDGYRDFH